ncbi:Lsr2 family protein [Streptomyces sp. ET3-23]|uniref:Lsr2 family DNA-binding protein n=1 Tax=Streptomyces sp. ET3-23 TaxID=2885643 RepID=UPI001D11FD13|nr:histone-like nucleoid-structuring protein Lsr2 [Streptomyces sp. ET3-23]MCC2279500.1 Lsr2 family protein [Streptomyces sp. ET3-23]
MDALCMGCKKKEQPEDRPATTVIAVGHRGWDLCEEHAQNFGGYLVDLFGSDGLEPIVEARGSVVITGAIPGYEPDAARLALENSGYRIVGHVEEDTALIICGVRPAPHKVQEAEKAGTPCMDATRAGAFREAVTSGRWTGEDPLPAVAQKKTSADVRRESDEQRDVRRKREAEAMEKYNHWRATELPKRMEESTERWAEERREKEDFETRRLVKAQMPPELSEAEKIRAWARENGFTVSNKGRIPASVKQAYEHAHAGQQVLQAQAG